MEQTNVISFKIDNTKIDRKNKIKKLYENSEQRKQALFQDYAEAFYSRPMKTGEIKFNIALEYGYQKAIRELEEILK